jgi:hypothetical protein
MPEKIKGDVMRPEATNRSSRPDERQCALLIAHLLATKQKNLPGDRTITRARLSEISLQRMFKRRRISPELLAEVQEWLFRVGWVLFFAGTTYAVVKMEVINGWGRISSKWIEEDIEKAGRGEFEYDTIEHLLLEPEERNPRREPAPRVRRPT